MAVRSNEKLRTQLMGKNWKGAKRGGVEKPTSSVVDRKRHPPRQVETDLSSEDDVGRTSLGKAKAGGGAEAEASKRYSAFDNAKDGAEITLRAKTSRSADKAKPANYLDEVLAQREQKRVRKKNRHNVQASQ